MSFMKRSVCLLFTLIMLTTIVPVGSMSVSAAFSGVLQFNEAGKFTVMQITDIQDGANVNSRVLAMITNAITRYSPDLVVFTGDNVKGSMLTSAFKSSVDQFLAPLLNTNTKFAVTFGNHDDEGTWLWKTSREDQYAYYKSKGGNNFIDHDVPALDGVGSGVIPIYAKGQTAGTPAFQIYLMDSGTYASSGGYDCPKTNQIDYYIQRSLQYPNVPSLWYMHIIVPDVYWQTMTQVSSGTPNSYGGNGSPFSSSSWILNPDRINWAKSGGTAIAEIYKEPPCPANQSVYESADRRSSTQYGSKTLYEAWVAYGNMLGTYYGHDHKNTFVTTTQHGIDIGYGKGATLNSYNDGNPGLRIYELDVNGTYATESVTESDLAKVLVKFNANGGTGAMTGQVIAKNATAALKPNTFVREGFEFSGWSTDPAGAVMYADAAPFTAGTTDITLYAQWQTNAQYTITFNANGGTGGTGPVLMSPGDVLQAPIVSRTGYTFAGWQPEVPPMVGNQDMEYIAQWTANTYTINYLGNGSSSGSTASSLHTYDVVQNLTANGYFKVGHSFLGWSMSPSATTPTYTDSHGVLNLSEVSGAELSFYAVWAVNEYTITFDANGGEGSLQVTAAYGNPLTPPNVTREGYIFVGWSPEVPPTVPDSDNVYTAVWVVNPPVLTPNDQTNTVIDQATGFIFGLNPGTTQAVFENSLVTVGGNGHLVITPTAAGFGTGTKVELLNNEDDEVVAVYYVLIFGDSTGDGSIDGNDVGRIIDTMNWLHTWDPEILSLMILAADLNGDGVVDGVDADILVEVENWNMRIDQTTGLALLI